jgi:hypothetical protein
LPKNTTCFDCRQVVSLLQSGLGKLPHILAHACHVNCGIVQIKDTVNRALQTNKTDQNIWNKTCIFECHAPEKQEDWVINMSRHDIWYFSKW